ncbi:MAG: DUF885 domain-containing protein [Pseudomonadota bacterium]
MFKIFSQLWLVVAVSVVLVACGTDTAPELDTTEVKQTETERLNAWLEEQYEEELMQSPIGLTFQGRKERYGEIDDMSEAAEDEQLAWKANSVEMMKTMFDYEALTDDAKLSYDLWAYQLKGMEVSREWRRHTYIYHQMTGWHSYLPTILMGFHEVQNKSDLEALVSRIGESGRAINQLTERVKAAAADGIRPPRFAYEIVREQSTEIITGEPFTESDTDSPLWANVQEKAAALVESGALTQEESDSILVDAQAALLEKLGPAYQGIVAFLTDDMENTTELALGVMALPDGEAAYNAMLWQNTTTDMTADEIHELGLSEVARIRAEMEAIKDKVEFEGTLPEFFAFLRDSKDDERFFFPNTDEGRKGYIDQATAKIDNIESQLTDYFGILPKADLIVKRVEAFREQPGAPQHYFPPTPDGSRPGIYYAHLADMKAMPINELEVIAYHEGLPGHHMQIAIAQELEGIPTFRTQAGFTAYIEGWALYTEKLATEIPGTYENPYSDFGRLGSEIWRAIRLVVDTGMHAKGWSQQQAVDFFAENSAAPLAQIEAEVRRYLVIPGQATSYKVGMIDIQRLRKLATDELGDKFDIRTFHDVVLGGGALPLGLLDRRVKQYIEEAKAS